MSPPGAAGGPPRASTERAAAGGASRAAFGSLTVFLIAVLGALAVTLGTGTAEVRAIAVTAVVPIAALTLVLLYFERLRRRWSYGGAAALGIVGVTLRLAINARPSLEVGGGLPLPVTVGYVAVGLAVVGTSLWAYRVAAPPRPVGGTG